MQYKARRRKALFVILIAALLLTAQLRPQAESADTFISKECVSYCEEIGGQYGICPELLEAIMESESSGDQWARNGNCKGLMQINMTYHKSGNILLAADYLSELFLEYNDVGTVLMLYNGSRNAVERGKRADYTEYALKIMKRSEQLERLHQK